MAYGKAKTGKNAVDAGVKKEIGSPASSGTAGTAVTPGNDSEEACPEVSSMDVEGGDVPAVTPTPSAPAAQAAELSLLSALSAGHLMRAHMQYNRKEAPVQTVDDTPAPAAAEMS